MPNPPLFDMPACFCELVGRLARRVAAQADNEALAAQANEKAAVSQTAASLEEIITDQPSLLYSNLAAGAKGGER